MTQPSPYGREVRIRIGGPAGFGIKAAGEFWPLWLPPEHIDYPGKVFRRCCQQVWVEYVVPWFDL